MNYKKYCNQQNKKYYDLYHDLMNDSENVSWTPWQSAMNPWWSPDPTSRITACVNRADDRIHHEEVA